MTSLVQSLINDAERDLSDIATFLDRHSLTVDDLALLALSNSLPRLTVLNGRPMVSRSAAYEWRLSQEMTSR